MRIEPISLFDGEPNWNVFHASGVKSVDRAKRLEAEERREREKIKKKRKQYNKSMNDLALTLNDKQVGTYNNDGDLDSYDVSGALFDNENDLR